MRNVLKRAGEIAKRTFAGEPALYAYKEQPLQTSPGAGNFAFIPLTGLPLESLAGRGYSYGKVWGMPQAQLYYGQEQVVTGLEGITAPGIQPTPLIDMESYLAELSALQSETFEGAQ